jgi:hypothetical protein
MINENDGTIYTSIPRENGMYAVEVLPIADLPRFVEGFKSKAEAEQWIFDRATAQNSGLPDYAGPLHSTPGVL